jgi:phage recombination protein Bet
MTAAIAIRPAEFSRDQIDLIKRTICPDASDDELQLFVQVAQRLQLDPFARQIFAVFRWNKKANRNVMQTQVSVDGFRVVAERNGNYAGQLGPFWTADGETWREVWLDKDPPKAAKVGVLRNDFKEPLWAVATWEQYKQEGQYGLTEMWKRMGPLMLGKCAECLALRRAFPNELGGVYSPEEMAQADAPAYTPPQKEAAPAGPKAGAPMITGAAATESPRAGTPMTATSTTASPAKPARANTIKHDGKLATAGQVAKLHALKKEVGGLTEDAYRKQLAAFKRQDGTPCEHSNELSVAQISNLIDRYEAKIKQQGARAIAAQQELAPAVPPANDPPPPLEDLLTAAFPLQDDEKRWLHDRFGVNAVSDLEDRDFQTAYELLSLGYQTSEYEEMLTKYQAMRKCG